MRCAEILSGDVAWVSPNATIDDAATVMQQASVEVLPVCDPKGFILGVLTDRDIAVSVALGDSKDTAVREMMSNCALVCASDDEVSVAHALMQKFHVWQIVCMGDNGRAAGILRREQIARGECGGAA